MMNPLAQLDADARRIVGKPIVDCTVDDLDRISKTIQAEATAQMAAVDQAQMVLAEARACGCDTIWVPNDDISRAVVEHTCGRSA